MNSMHVLSSYLSDPQSSQALATALARPAAGLLSRMRWLSSSRPATLRMCLLSKMKNIYGNLKSQQIIYYCLPATLSFTAKSFISPSQLKQQHTVTCFGKRFYTEGDRDNIWFGFFETQEKQLPEGTTKQHEMIDVLGKQGYCFS